MINISAEEKLNIIFEISKAIDRAWAEPDFGRIDTLAYALATDIIIPMAMSKPTILSSRTNLYRLLKHKKLLYLLNPVSQRTDLTAVRLLPERVNNNDNSPSE